MGWTRSSDGCACGGGHYCESEVTALRAERDVALAHNRAMLREFDALRADRDALREYALADAGCPCCGEEVTCIKGCTFEADCPTEHDRMAAARAALALSEPQP
ncbi:MAG TPA: hypothetical protein VFH61_17335 [Thermoleophilia bacterium]|nr:hypothetical protein [Thermoleophilia bacterium]